ncbi:MAG: enoyl-CoA hydratase-related protein [Candidatus Dormibacteria bacterium]
MPDPPSEPVLVERDGPVTVLTLNRPNTLNAIDLGMAQALRARVAEVAADRQCRCLVLTGAGRGFCSGQALPGGAGGEELSPDIAGLVRERYIPIITGLRALELPVLAALNGVAAGAGLSLALAADLRVMSESAFLSCAFSGIGLVPDAGASFFLPRYVGLARAAELALSGARVPASMALELGLATHVYPSGDFDGAWRQFARQLAAGATRAFALTKRNLDRALGSTLEEQLETEARAQQQASETEDFKEGLEAFSAKRAPRFRGR